MIRSPLTAHIVSPSPSLILIAALSSLCLTGPAQAATWDGSDSTSWTDPANWVGNNPAGNQVGGAKGNEAVFGVRQVGAFDPTHNAPNENNEISRLLFQDEWTLTLNRDVRLGSGKGIDVNIAGKDGTAIINGGNGKDLLFFDSPTHEIAAGDTLIINRGWEHLNDNRDHTFTGGGTIVLNGEFASGTKEKDVQFRVTGNTTLVANTLMRLGGDENNGSEALNVAAGSTLAGTGGLVADFTEGSRSAAINGTLTPGWGATPIDDLSFRFVRTLNLNGVYQVDINAAGDSDSILANFLNLGANSILEVSGVGGAEAYVIAEYGLGTTGVLAGVFDEANSILPVGYEIDYAYEGNQIALVLIPEPASLALLVLGGAFMLPRRSR